ncbi:MAG: hypothetical protein OEN50_18825 [Deltaproteobacteria bacterium]|nr:hypothetical protein [Deltaproteobacteria bacterium]
MPNLKQRPDVRAITIAIVRNQKDALRIQQKLKGAGIECVQTAERSIATDKTTAVEIGAVKIQVARADVQRALNVLSATDDNRRRGKLDEKSVKPRSRTSLSPAEPAGNPTVPAIVIAFIVLAALIIFLF